ncbi:hypothetical protein [Echinicola rosea]|uniref:DUF4440 domain-containing protein n=1 Tax=Echinicola rosea TaxID=1807691 RepID=A0ABQ1UDC9_9BACT|nr:hypothetical protein [Echinicola rosea]GGF16161.1 hypothetical protein GCM10011339_00060 [Echinicola rosea]
MIRTLTLAVVFICFSAIVFAQQHPASGIQKAAKEFAQANMEEDFETLIKYTYPVVMEKSGGKEGVKKALADAYDLLKIRGMKIISFEVGKPIKTTHTAGEIHALVPVVYKTHVPKGEIVSQTTLIAVSDDATGNWYFIETSGLDPKNIHNYLPTWDYTLGLHFDSSKEFIASKSSE